LEECSSLEKACTGSYSTLDVTKVPGTITTEWGHLVF